MKQRIIIVCVLLCAMTACSGLRNLPALNESSQRSDYELGSGDNVRVLIYGEEELPEEYAVNDAGKISLPLIGAVEARGQTTAQLERNVVSALKAKGIVRDPQVSVEVRSYRPFYILGEVEDPGQYPYHPDMTVLTAAAIGGGFTPRAYTKNVAITRTVGGQGQGQEWQANRNTVVQPGDVIFVHERLF